MIDENKLSENTTEEIIKEEDSKESAATPEVAKAESKLGLRGLKRTKRPVPVEPEVSSIAEKVEIEKVAEPAPKKPKTSTDIKLPKSIRITKKAHTAIATISMIEDIKQYEVINEMVDNYINSMDPSMAKLVRSSIKRL